MVRLETTARFTGAMRALAASVVFALAALLLAPASAQAREVFSVSGETRYETAAAQALAAYPEGAEVAIVVSGQNWADSLSASGLAGALDCNEEYLRGEQELFLTRAGEEYGARGRRQAQAFLDSTRAMFAGGDLSPEDIDMIGKHFMEMFWEAKENARKYTPKKYRDDASAGDNG